MPYRFRGVGSRGSARRLGIGPLRFSDPSSWADAEDAPQSALNRIAGFRCSFAALIQESLAGLTEKQTSIQRASENRQDDE